MVKLFCLILSASFSLGATWQEKVVAAVIAGEARGEGQLGLIAVGEVIHQRCLERRQTPFQVVTARHAFNSKAGLTAEQVVRRYSSQAGYAAALEVANVVCNCPESLPGVTHHANHFDSKFAKPKWARGLKPVATVNNHAFYRVR